MKFHRDLRQELLREFQARFDHAPEMREEFRTNPRLQKEYIEAKGNLYKLSDLLDEFDTETLELGNAINVLEPAKIIVFSREQAEIFLGLTQKIMADGEDAQSGIALDFRLPFANLFLQFSEPLPIEVWGSEDTLLGIGLHQFELDAQSATYANYEAVKRGMKAYARAGDFFNEILMVFGDHNIRCMAWTSRRNLFLEAKPDVGEDILAGWEKIRTLSIACIGYINCVNVELVKEGEVSAAVNRKRAREGKKQLEPYYLCRIALDVKRKEAVKENESGIHHGYRYDVRGHFRNLATGRTIWIPPHQRGLAHELYIPKRLVV